MPRSVSYFADKQAEQRGSTEGGCMDRSICQNRSLLNLHHLGAPSVLLLGSFDPLEDRGVFGRIAREPYTTAMSESSRIRHAFRL